MLRTPVEATARPHPNEFAQPRGDAFSQDGHSVHRGQPEAGRLQGEVALPAPLWKGELPVRRWWEEPALPRGQKWRTLRHNGPAFPPPYRPHRAPLYYEGRAVLLTPEQEEVASFYAAQLTSQHMSNPTFRHNFFRQFKEILQQTEEGRQVADVTKLDFTKIYEALELRKEERRASKDALKADRAKLQEAYGVCLMDGHPVRVSAFMMVPPGLFLGRGQHPKAGVLNRRISPEDVIINIGAGEPVPPPPPGHQWAEVRHDQTAAWLFAWRNNVTGSAHFCFPLLDPQRGLFQTFERAREVGPVLPELRRSYSQAMRGQTQQQRQLGTAAYLVDRLGLRVGNEKESERVGCCTLCAQHIVLGPDHLATLVAGRDSLRWEGQIDPTAWDNLREFKSGKAPSDLLFDSLAPAQLRDFLAAIKPALTPKVIRTCNFSSTLEEELEGGLHSNDPVAFYRSALQTLQGRLNTPVLYADPRVIVAWAKKAGVDMSRLLSAAQRERYSWALDTPAAWRFRPAPPPDISKAMEVCTDRSHSDDDSSEESEEEDEDGFQGWIFRASNERPVLSPFAQLVLVIQTWWTEDTTGWLQGTFGNTEQFRRTFSAPNSLSHPLVKRKAELEHLLARIAAPVVLDPEFFQLAATLDEEEIACETLRPEHWDVLYLTVLQTLSGKLHLAFDEAKKQAVLAAAGFTAEQYLVLLDVASAPH